MSLPLPTTPQEPRRWVAVVGAGRIGIAWSVVFASAGLGVRVYEPLPSVRSTTRAEVEALTTDLAAAGLLDDPAALIVDRVVVCATLDEAVADVEHVQECLVEDLAVKRELFAELDRLTAPDTVLASSTSTFMTSLFAASLPGRERCLVVHPANPPYFLRLAEVVPAPFTASAVMARAQELLRTVGLTPILLHREIEGFAYNRIQAAVLREAYCLVRDGIVDPADIDTLVRDGLGLRWSVIGPFTTSELNTRGGIRRHAQVLGPVYARMGAERSGENPWTPDTVEEVAQMLQERLPHGTWEENVRERDRAMIRLASLLRDFSNPLAPVTQDVLSQVGGDRAAAGRAPAT
jgi:L-gulonate 3-dehydrogenase